MTSVPASDAAAPADPRVAVATACMLGAVAIWGLQFVMIRLAVTTSLTALDVVLLRYLFGLPVMLTILLTYGWRNGAGLGWGRAIVLTLLGGAPMLMLSNIGLYFAPANQASCLQPGTVAVVSTLYMLVTGGVRRTLITPVGLALAVAGLAAVTLGAGTGGPGGEFALIGDALFVLSGLCWASYTILLVRWKASPLVSTAFTGVVSLLAVPLFLPLAPMRIATAPWTDILMHGLFQGIFNFAIAFLMWAYAAKVLGAVRIGFFAPLIPVTGVLWAIPMLGETPAPAQWLGVAGVVGGLTMIALSQRTPRPAAFTKP